jgi:hypothetical protein
MATAAGEAEKPQAKKAPARAKAAEAATPPVGKSPARGAKKASMSNGAAKT